MAALCRKLVADGRLIYMMNLRALLNQSMKAYDLTLLVPLVHTKN